MEKVRIFIIIHSIIAFFTKKTHITTICYFFIQFFFINILCYFFYKYSILQIQVRFPYLTRFNCEFSELNIFFLFILSFIFSSLQIFEYTSKFKKVHSLILKSIYIFCFIRFVCKNLLIFLFCFERTAIFLFLSIIETKTEKRRILARYYLFFYTIVGSIPFLLSLVYLFKHTYTLQAENILLLHSNRQKWIFIRMSFTFLIKLPCRVFYNWLIEAHVEATTTGSIILARIILKIGRYGFRKFVFLNFPIRVIKQYQDLFIILFFFSFLFRRLSLFTHNNLKKLIAFSSIRHMNLRFLRLTCYTQYSYFVFFIFLISHSLIRSGLFFLRGKIYDRTNQKNFQRFAGLSSYNPVISLYFRFLIIANLNFPFTRNFFAEFFFFSIIREKSIILSVCLRVIITFFRIYWIFLYCSIFFGRPQKKYYIDLTIYEFSFLRRICFLLFFIRFNPFFFFNY